MQLVHCNGNGTFLNIGRLEPLRNIWRFVVGRSDTRMVHPFRLDNLDTSFQMFLAIWALKDRLVVGGRSAAFLSIDRVARVDKGDSVPIGKT